VRHRLLTNPRFVSSDELQSVKDDSPDNCCHVSELAVERRRFKKHKDSNVLCVAGNGMLLAYATERIPEEKCSRPHQIQELSHLIRMISERPNAKSAELKFIQPRFWMRMWNGISNASAGSMTNCENSNTLSLT